MHGAGSPQAQRIMIARQSNLAHKKQLAKDLAGVGLPVEPQKNKLRKPAGVK
jgi:aromatic ring hydroxylase